MPEIPPRSPIADAPLSMILIASNAELFFDHLLERWYGALKSKVRDFEIVLVDDASTDGTLAQATALKKKHAELTIVGSEPPHGAGASWRAALTTAQHRPLLGFAEFSPDYNPDDFAKFLEIINEVDLISGMRATRPSRWSGRALLERWIFGVRLSDATCPFKLLRRTVFDHLRLQSRGDFVQTEVVAKANFLGCLLAEVPVDFLRAQHRRSRSLLATRHEARLQFPRFRTATATERTCRRRSGGAFGSGNRRAGGGGRNPLTIS